jgi:PAS domain S-box-containing protein
LAARVSEARSPGSFDLGRVDLLAALIGLLGVLTSALLFALTRSQLATRRAVRAGAVALEREEALRAHVEQQGLAARREAQERLALIDALFRATPAGLAVFDRQLRFVRLNHGLCDLHGLPAGAHLGRRVSQVVPSLSAAEAALAQVLERGEARTVELSGCTPAFPDLRTLLCNFAPVRNENGEVVGVAAVVFDITQRKRAEQESKALLEELRAEREVAAVLHRVGQQIAAELNLERLAQALADAAARVTNADVAALAYAPSGDWQAAEWALSGPEQEAWKGLTPQILLKGVEHLPRPAFGSPSCRGKRRGAARRPMPGAPTRPFRARL